MIRVQRQKWPSSVGTSLRGDSAGYHAEDGVFVPRSPDGTTWSAWSSSARNIGTEKPRHHGLDDAWIIAGSHRFDPPRGKGQAKTIHELIMVQIPPGNLAWKLTLVVRTFFAFALRYLWMKVAHLMMRWSYVCACPVSPPLRALRRDEFRVRFLLAYGPDIRFSLWPAAIHTTVQFRLPTSVDDHHTVWHNFINNVS